MGDDEINAGVFCCQQFYDGYFAHNIVKNGQMERCGGFTNLPAEPGIMAVRFYAAKSVFVYGCLKHSAYMPPISFAMYESKPEKPIAISSHNAGHSLIGTRITFSVECGKKIGLAYTCLGRPPKESPERRRGIPRAAQAVAFAGMAVAINDAHGVRDSFH